MRAWKAHVVTLMLASMVLQTLAATPASADHFFGRLWRLEEEKWYDGKEPADMCQDDAIQELAMNIDWLEHHIDTYGSIVAKQPDIWGEARLTKHRDEYERMMYEQLNQFRFTLNASIRQTDSSFLAQALALSAAVDDESETPATAIAEADADADGAGQGMKVEATAGETPTVTAQLADPDDITTCPEKVSGGINLEPTVLLDQMSRYLQHLHELRRINEGDDTSDSPGYSLNLVRIPVSMLPGKLTREGWGAEITVTATPVLSADLMPTTFRNLVINDLVDTLGLPLVRLTERHLELPTPERMAANKRQVEALKQAEEAAGRAFIQDQIQRNALPSGARFNPGMAIESVPPTTAGDALLNVQRNLAMAQAEVAVGEQPIEPSMPLMSTGRSRRATNPLPSSQLNEVIGYAQLWRLSEFFCKNYQGANVRWAGDPRCAEKDKNVKEFRVSLLDAQSWLGAELAAAHEMLCQPNHIMLWYALANQSSELARAIRSEHFRSGVPGQPSVEDLRHAFFTHLHSHGNLSAESFSEPLPCIDQMMAPEDSPAYAQTVTEALAWAIVVESSLLNQRLEEDVRKTAEAKHSYSIPVSDETLSFFLPEAAGQPTSPLLDEFSAATQVFQEYVRVRWPIHVFAVDPREQDQNVADFSARRRELQFALALGFVTGQTSANSLTQFSRELETQIETITLNRTIVGFGHGTETFGWRFYPRVQALDVPGTAGAIWETIHGASRDHDLRKRQLEPGMRECVAIVLMPSFVPYADFDVRANWFRLTNPKNAALTMKDTMKLSRAITAMRNSQAQCARCAHCYREGEVERLLKRVEQLDRELPLQTMRAQVPYENTLGGFEMFNTGVTDLAPEFVGWYGAPGIVTTGWNAAELYKCGCFEPCQFGANGTPDSLANRVTVLENTVKGTREAPLFQSPLAICQGQGTTLFLVGDHLSVHDTKIIAGGVCIPDVRLVSRQIVRVTIPSCVNTVEVDGKPYVAVYAATPYGVTNHLHIPVHPRTLTTQVQDQIAATVKSQVPGVVKAEVEAALRAATLNLRSVRVTRPSGTTKVVATCTPGNAANPGSGGLLVLALVNGDRPFPVKLTALGPELIGKELRLFFALRHRGEYITPLIKLVPADGGPNADRITLSAIDPTTEKAVVIKDSATFVDWLSKKFDTISSLEGKASLDIEGDFYVQIGDEAERKADGTMVVKLEAPCKCCDSPDAPKAATTPAPSDSPPATPTAPAGAPAATSTSESLPGGPVLEALPAPQAIEAAPPCVECSQLPFESELIVR